MTFTILSIFEILFINLFHTHIISIKKYSNLVSFLVLFFFTFILFGLLYLFDGIKIQTTVRSVLVGLLYIIPLYYLYNTTFKKLITIIIYCWNYTMLINALSFGIVNLVSNQNDNLMYIFVLQTFLLASTILYVFKFSRTKFIIILEKASIHTQKLLIILGFSIFSVFVSIRYYVDSSHYEYLFLTIFIIIITVTSNILLYTIVQSTVTLTSTKTIAFKDSLTGINNRYSLFRDLELLIKKEKPFSIIFLDLDDLKSINDKYSHHVGDKYLIEFARVLTKLISINGDVYRFAGDEFVCLITGSTLNMIEIEKQIAVEMNITYEFVGVSIGISHFPESGMSPDELIHKADNAMYGDKRSKKIRR